MDDALIRPISDIVTLRRLEELQQRIWAGPEREVVPAHQLLAAAAAGGVVLGAFAPGGDLVGFCYGFLGQRQGRPLFYSHMAGVIEEWRGRDVGFRLKQAQRREALARGLAWMVWTFDPLQSTNAYFNLHRLGAEARRYYVNYYGEMPDELNRGVESDRLEVDWFLRSPRVEGLMHAQARDKRQAEPSQPTEAAVALAGSSDPLPRPADPVLDLDAPEVRVEIPPAFTPLRTADLGLAREWRATSREVFRAYFERGYAAVDFVRTPALGYYVLRRARAD